MSLKLLKNKETKLQFFDKSPPALEKCESSFAEGDALKIEEDESQDNINDTTEDNDKLSSEHQANEETAAQEPVESPTAVKFMYVKSCFY